MLVPVIAGSDKTTVSVATGHQEYHPLYASSGIISNTARRGHGNGVIPFAFLPIPKGICLYLTIIKSDLV
jgi:Plavaka transposase